ncbi:Luciferin 4-monooxygenase [Eumeta japonica]|uniref:Luciferin 4-monooxygenase n=1 Tax=Eumeta variegata TaxID=151549 RepID=A0A4C1YUA5_EUMVA|nr:Luciferin 4-monooxygenase [Eumeta japonica]
MRTHIRGSKHAGRMPQMPHTSRSTTTYYIYMIVDVNTREPLGPRKTGEICVKGPVLMKGYIGIPREQYLDEEGFLKTGDLGYYDEDQYLYITDRIKDIIKYEGFQVSPVELEAVLLQHSAVKEAGVVGRPDPDYGELPMAFVVKQSGAKTTEQELIEHVASQVSPYMQLRGGVKFVAGLPRNPRGKLLRRELKEMIKEMD